MITKLILVWALAGGSPGEHRVRTRPIREAARIAVADQLRLNHAPTHVACVIMGPAEGNPHEDRLSCRAEENAADALADALEDASAWLEREAVLRAEFRPMCGRETGDDDDCDATRFETFE